MADVIQLSELSADQVPAKLRPGYYCDRYAVASLNVDEVPNGNLINTYNGDES